MKKIVLGGFIAVILLGLMVSSPKEKTPLFVEEGVKMEDVNVLNLTDSIGRTETTRLGLFKDNIYKWENGKLHLRSLSEEGKSSNIALNMTWPIIETGDEYIYLANSEEGIIYVVDDQAEMVERLQVEPHIFNLKHYKDNLIYHNRDGRNETLGIITSEGQKAMKYSFDTSILNYSYLPEKENLVIASLNVGDQGLGSKLDFYNKFVKEEEASLYFDSEIVMDIHHMKLGNVLVLTDRSLYYISESEIVWKKDYNLIKDLQLIDGNIYLLAGNSLINLNLKGEEKNVLNLNDDYKDVKFFKDSLLSKEIILYNSEKLTIYKNEKEYLTHIQPIEKLDVYEDYIFLLDQEKYGFYVEGVAQVEVKEEE